MATEIRYNATLISIHDGQTIILGTKNKLMSDNILISESADPFRSYVNGETTELIIDSKKVANFSFKGMVNITSVTFKDAVEIGSQAFSGCTALQSIIFKSTPASVAEDAFSNCPRLRKIIAPWAEGDIENAPWGATNAIIDYTHTRG